MKPLIVLLAGIVLSTPAEAAHRLEAATKTYPLDGISRLAVDFNVGELSVEGDEGKDVRLSVQVRCRRGSLEDCEERARRLTIDHDRSAGRLRIGFQGIPKSSSDGFTVSAVLLVPRKLSTRVDMGVGELDVRGMAGPLDLELGVGEMDVRLEAAGYGSAKAAAGIGDVNIRAPSGRMRDRGFLGRTARWEDGAGAHTVDAHVGVGEANIQLR